MSKKSTLCYQCEYNGKIPISYRDDNRIYRVAFYVCSNCMHFSGFCNWTSHRFMPYFNKIGSFIQIRLVKNFKNKPSDKISRNKRVRLMQKDPYLPCIKCKKFDFSKLYLRNRKKKHV